MPLDLKLETSTGFAYADSEQIDLVSAPFRKPGQAPVFMVSLRSGSKVYLLENASNLNAIRESKAVKDRGLMPHTPQAPAQADAPKRGRGRPKKEKPQPKGYGESDADADRKGTPHV